MAQAAHPESLPIDEVYLIACHNADTQYFIRPTGIVYAMSGLNGAPSCMMAVDTEGVTHILCQTKNSPDICILVEPGPNV
jgi:hypothetical protein